MCLFCGGACQVKFRLLQLKYFEYFPLYLGVAQKVISNLFFTPVTEAFVPHQNYGQTLTQELVIGLGAGHP